MFAIISVVILSKKTQMTITTKVQAVFCDIQYPAPQNTETFRLDNENFENADLARINLSSASLVNANLRYTDLTLADFREADLTGAELCGATGNQSRFHRSNLTDANLRDSTFQDANFVHANLANANLTNISLSDSHLSNANLTNANLTGAFLESANLAFANLSGANLTNANLSGAWLHGVNLTGAIGLGTRKEEVEFAKELLEILQSKRGYLEMDEWHSEACATAHCLAGFIYPEIIMPAQKASLKCPTLAQFFFKSNQEVMEALRAVASGELSVFPD